MAQQPETLFDHMPCPDCGSKHLVQHISQSEDVYVNEDGDFENIEPRDTIDVQQLWCPECDELLWEAEESEEKEYTVETVSDSGIILRGQGGVRAITSPELDQLLNTDDPVTIR